MSVERPGLDAALLGLSAGETRTFDAALGVTRPMRGKEEAHDYRYFPEPDLPPLVLGNERIEALRAELPELPWQRRARFAAHTAFDDPTSPPDAAPRESIEARTVAFFD